jgi:hypothetical protein
LSEAAQLEDRVDVDRAEYNVDTAETKRLMKEDVNFFGGICLPEVFTLFFPPILLAIWNLLVQAAIQARGKLQLAIGLPRGFAKTLFLKLFVLYCIFFTDRKFILIVCNTEPLAINFIADIVDVLDSPNIKMLFGDWRLGIDRATLHLKKFGFRGRTIVLAAIGVGTSMRGLNIKFERPDVILMDDMQSREDAEAPDVAKKQLLWLMGTLMKARNYKRCLFIYVGNMYPTDGCILRKLKHSKQWISFICGGILADGTSLWEELRPVNDLLQELENDIELGHPEIFYSEVQNDEEAGTVSGIDVSRIPAYPAHLDGIEPQAGFIIIDPATKKNKITNDTAIGVFLVYDGVPVFRKLTAEIMSPLEAIRKSLELAFTFGIKCICVESNAYQFTFLFWFNWICQQIEVSGINLCELYSGVLSKNAKIKGTLPKLLKKQGKDTAELLLHPEVREQVVYQITQWNPLKLKNVDDILDLMGYVDKAIEMYGTEMELQGTINLQIDLVPPAAFNGEHEGALLTSF